MTRRQFRALSKAGVLCPAQRSPRLAHRVGSRAHPVSKVRVPCPACVRYAAVVARLQEPTTRKLSVDIDSLLKKVYAPILARFADQEIALYSQLKDDVFAKKVGSSIEVRVPLNCRTAADGHRPTEADAGPTHADDPARRDLKNPS